MKGKRINGMYVKNCGKMFSSTKYSLMNVSRKLGVSKSSFIAYDNGYNRMPIEVVEAYEALLEARIEELVEFKHKINEIKEKFHQFKTLERELLDE